MAVLKLVPRAQAFEPDERQRQAIEHIHGPLLVVAGAGTGKTTVLTRRIASLLTNHHARPDQILALTYTENATTEMRERIQGELQGVDISGIEINTFHGYCYKLLERSGKKFALLDDKDLWIYLRRHIRALRLSYFVRAANVGQFLSDLLDFMRRCQDELVGPERYARYVEQVGCGELAVPRVSKSKDALSLSDEEVVGRCQEIARVFTTVERMLQAENLGTFGHMISKAHDLLHSDDQVLARERERIRFILVDEFQDANFAQVRILQKIAGDERNVFAVGDPDQAIYRFRGASNAAFGLFLRQFPGTGLVVLEKNRRSTTPILRTGFALISQNPEALIADKNAVSPYRRSPLISAREEAAIRSGQPVPALAVEAVVLDAKEAEGFDIVATLRKKQRETRCKWEKFGILYRQHFHRDKLVEELAQQGIPFTIENMDVLDTSDVRDLLACLGAVVSTSDGGSLFRVAALLQFGIDPEKLRAGLRTSSRNTEDSSVVAVLNKIEGGSAVVQAVQEAQQEIIRAKALSAAALDILIRRFALPRSPQVSAVQKFVADWEKKPITMTGEISELVQYLEEFRQAQGTICLPASEDDAVRLMTAHAAKGLEFDHVFILRAVSTSFPMGYKESLVEFPPDLRDPDSVALDEGKVLHDQEERRLFYVAMTRARDSLTIYAQKGRGKKDQTPPGFLRYLIKDSTLSRWFQQRSAVGFQTQIFAEAQTSVTESRVTEWMRLPPAFDLASRLSSTAVEAYDRCPLQFKMQREWNLPREVPAALHYGAAMHLALRTYYDSVRAARPLSLASLVDLFRATLAEARIQDRYQHDLYEKQGIDQLTDFIEACGRQPSPEVLHTEESFEVRVGRSVVAGRIDRMDRIEDGAVLITDYKTGRPRTQEDADGSLQLTIYALAAREKWGYRTDRLVFYNLQENRAVVTQRTEADLQGVRARLEEVAENIAAGDFEPHQGFHCSWCPYRSLCPATEKRIYLPTHPKKVRSAGQN